MISAETLLSSNFHPAFPEKSAGRRAVRVSLVCNGAALGRRRRLRWNAKAAPLQTKEALTARWKRPEKMHTFQHLRPTHCESERKRCTLKTHEFPAAGFLFSNNQFYRAYL